MAKLNLLLLVILVVCALGLVTSQHRARKMYSDLEREQTRSRDLEIDYGRLQLEASTWGQHARIEALAKARLEMRAPDARRVRLIGLPAAAAPNRETQ